MRLTNEHNKIKEVKLYPSLLKFEHSGEILKLNNDTIYNEDVILDFSEGTVKLNGRDVPSGTTITKEGRYEVDITDIDGNSRTIRFTI